MKRITYKTRVHVPANLMVEYDESGSLYGAWRVSVYAAGPGPTTGLGTTLAHACADLARLLTSPFDPGLANSLYGAALGGPEVYEEVATRPTIHALVSQAYWNAPLGSSVAAMPAVTPVTVMGGMPTSYHSDLLEGPEQVAAYAARVAAAAKEADIAPEAARTLVKPDFDGKTLTLAHIKWALGRLPWDYELDADSRYECVAVQTLKALLDIAPDTATPVVWWDVDTGGYLAGTPDLRYDDRERHVQGGPGVGAFVDYLMDEGFNADDGEDGSYKMTATKALNLLDQFLGENPEFEIDGVSTTDKREEVAR